jgi:hypothetical protein
MDGYEVITSDEERAGRVVGRENGYVVVEHGHLRKHRRLVPDAFVHVDDGEGVVRLTVSKQIVETAPELHDGEVDMRAVARHYGLADGFDGPETQGYGQLTADDPAISSEQQALSNQVEPAPAQRVRVREGMAPGEGPNDHGHPSPGVTGGDRWRDAR